MSTAGNGRGSIHRSRNTDGWEALVSLGKDPITGKQLRKKVRGRTKSEVRSQVLRLIDVHVARALFANVTSNNLEHRP